MSKGPGLGFEEGEASQSVLTGAGNKATKATGAARPRLGLGLAARVYIYKWPPRRVGGTWLISTEAEAEIWRFEAGFTSSANDSAVKDTAKGD